jgi:hypothetical protein
MDQPKPGRRDKHVKLVESRGPTSIFIDAEIDADGKLTMSGQDIGEAPKTFYGDSDYEYWRIVGAEHKDRLLAILLGREPAGLDAEQRDWALLAALEARYAGDLSAVSHFGDLLDAHGIEHQYGSY